MKSVGLLFTSKEPCEKSQKSGKSYYKNPLKGKVARVIKKSMFVESTEQVSVESSEKVGSRVGSLKGILKKSPKRKISECFSKGFAKTPKLIDGSKNHFIIGITGPFTTVEETVVPMNKYRISYAKAVERFGVNAIPVFLPCLPSMVQNYLNFCDGFIFSGGNGNISPSIWGSTAQNISGIDVSGRVEFEVELMSQIIKHNKPVLGVCLGLQVLNVALGGSIKCVPAKVDSKPYVQHYMDEKNLEVEGLKLRHIVSVLPTSVLYKILGKRKELEVNSAHQYCIDKLGKNLVPVSYASDNTIEAIELNSSNFVVGVQWHPELIQDEASSKQLFTAFLDAVRARRYNKLE